jgi:hypothetical protein
MVQPIPSWIPPNVQGKSNRDNLPTISENSKALRENKDSGGALDSSFRQVHAIVQSRTQNERSGCVSYSSVCCQRFGCE